MSTSIQFYHLLHTPLERALPKLLERVLAQGSRAVIRTASDADAERLCEQLWTFDTASFLPHGTAKDGNISEQPVFLTSSRDNANAADILILTDGSLAEDASAFSKVLDMFDGQDEQAVAAARTRWSHYKESGSTLAYYKQQPAGGWAAS